MNRAKAIELAATFIGGYQDRAANIVDALLAEGVQLEPPVVCIELGENDPIVDIQVLGGKVEVCQIDFNELAYARLDTMIQMYEEALQWPPAASRVAANWLDTLREELCARFVDRLDEWPDWLKREVFMDVLDTARSIERIKFHDQEAANAH